MPVVNQDGSSLEPEERAKLDKAARDWFVGRNVIAAFLSELCPEMSKEAREHNAAAILSRLAKNNLLLEAIE